MIPQCFAQPNLHSKLYELSQYLQGLIHIVLFSRNAVRTIVSVKLKSGPFEAHVASNSPLVKFSYFFNGIPVRFLKNSALIYKLLTGEVERHQISIMVGEPSQITFAFFGI